MNRWWCNTNVTQKQQVTCGYTKHAALAFCYVNNSSAAAQSEEDEMEDERPVRRSKGWKQPIEIMHTCWTSILISARLRWQPKRLKFLYWERKASKILNWRFEELKLLSNGGQDQECTSVLPPVPMKRLGWRQRAMSIQPESQMGIWLSLVLWSGVSQWDPNSGG